MKILRGLYLVGCLSLTAHANYAQNADETQNSDIQFEWESDAFETVVVNNAQSLRQRWTRITLKHRPLEDAIRAEQEQIWDVDNLVVNRVTTISNNLVHLSILFDAKIGDEADLVSEFEAIRCLANVYYGIKLLVVNSCYHDDLLFQNNDSLFSYEGSDFDSIVEMEGWGDDYIVIKKSE